MGKDKEERRMKVGRIFFIKFKLALKTVPRVIIGVNFVYPEGLLIKIIESQNEPNEEAEGKDQ